MAQVDYFLKIEGIDGESTDSKHKGEIDILSWSWGSTNSADSRGGGQGAGKVVVQDFHFTAHNSKASPKLMLGSANGEVFKSALLTARKAGKDAQEYLKIKLSDVIVSSYQTGGSQGSVVPDDQVSLNFGKIEYEYKEQKPDGNLGGAVKTGWNVKENKAV